MRRFLLWSTGILVALIALITTDSAYANPVGIQPKLRGGQISAMLRLSGADDPSAVNFEGNFGWFLETTLWAYSGAKNFREDERFRLMSVTARPVDPRGCECSRLDSADSSCSS